MKFKGNNCFTYSELSSSTINITKQRRCKQNQLYAKYSFTDNSSTYNYNFYLNHNIPLFILHLLLNESVLKWLLF